MNGVFLVIAAAPSAPTTQASQGWGAGQTATLLAALMAVLGVASTILTTAARARREHMATLYAQALAAVADYLEGPYRIRRKDGTPAHRNAITAGLSDVKSNIDHQQAMLQLHARSEVAELFDDFVLAAMVETGTHMHNAWLTPAITTDAEVNLKDSYERQLSEVYRNQVISIMKADLSRRWWNRNARNRFRRISENRLGPLRRQPTNGVT